MCICATLLPASRGALLSDASWHSSPWQPAANLDGRCVLQDKCHPQTIAVCQTRAEGLGLKVIVGKEAEFDINKDTCGVLLQYPATDGSIEDYKVGWAGTALLLPLWASPTAVIAPPKQAWGAQTKALGVGSCAARGANSLCQHSHAQGSRAPRPSVQA